MLAAGVSPLLTVRRTNGRVHPLARSGASSSISPDSTRAWASASLLAFPSEIKAPVIALGIGPEDRSQLDECFASLIVSVKGNLVKQVLEADDQGDGVTGR